MTTPDASPSWRAHMPAQLTTYSHAIVPAVVVTPVTARFFVVTPVAATPSTSVAPACRAPLASAMVTSTGSARPSSLT